MEADTREREGQREEVEEKRRGCRARGRVKSKGSKGKRTEV